MTLAGGSAGVFTVDIQAEDEAAKVTESHLFSDGGCFKQSCIILIPEPSFCQAIMGNLICSTLELKWGRPFYTFFLFVCCKWRIKFSLSFWYQGLNREALSTEAITVYILLYTYNKALLQQKRFFPEELKIEGEKWIWNAEITFKIVTLCGYYNFVG